MDAAAESKNSFIKDVYTQAWCAHFFKQHNSMHGKTFLITGASRGIGQAIARLCAYWGARVLLTARDDVSINALLVELHQLYGDVGHRAYKMDLADFASIDMASQAIAADRHSIDGVFANAGIAADADARTETGYNRTFFVNHIGHYAFLAKILPLLGHGVASRIVMQSSIRHWSAVKYTDFSCYFSKQNCALPSAYADSKFANVAFAMYLDNLCTLHKKDIRVLSAHPGYVLTDINKYAHDISLASMLYNSISGQWSRLVLQTIPKLGLAQPSIYAGALPSLFAMFAENPDYYYGPQGFLGLCGMPAVARMHKCAQKVQIQTDLWHKTEQFTEIQYF